MKKTIKKVKKVRRKKMSHDEFVTCSLVYLVISDVLTYFENLIDKYGGE